MRTSMTRRALAIVATAALAIVAAGCGSSDESGSGGGLTDAEPDVTYDLVVKDGAVVGGPQQFEAASGDVVRLAVQSDEDDAVHVHGVDIEVDLAADEPTDITFETGDSGSYEVELHESGALLGTLEVR